MQPRAVRFRGENGKKNVQLYAFNYFNFIFFMLLCPFARESDIQPTEKYARASSQLELATNCLLLCSSFRLEVEVAHTRSLVDEHENLRNLRLGSVLMTNCCRSFVLAHNALDACSGIPHNGPRPRLLSSLLIQLFQVIV
jgi:hypothetical protein